MSSSEQNNTLISPSVCVCGLPLSMLSVQVQATTGNVYYLRVAHSDTIDYIRRIIAKKTKLSKERILLLYKDRQLRDGSLEEHNIRDGSKLHLVPSVETGLLSQRPEQSVMQALESLNDGQVTDFLSGKAPLNLTMRLGDHMMLIQLQLSTVSPVQHHSSSSRSNSHHFTTLRRGYSSSSNSSSASSCTSSQTQNNSSQLHQQNHQTSSQKSILSALPTSTSSTSAQSSRHSSSRHHQHHHHHHHHHHHRNATSNGNSGGGAARHHHHHHGHHYHHSHPYYHSPYPQYQLLPQPHSGTGAVQQSKSATQPQPINLQQQQLQQQQQQHQKASPPAHQNPTTVSNTKNSNVLITSSCNSSTVSSHPVYSTPPRRSSSANNYSSPNFSSPASSLSSLSPSSPMTPWSPASFTPPPPNSSLHSSNYYNNNSTNFGYTPTSSSFTNQQPSQHMATKSSNSSSTSELPIRVCPHTSVDDLDLSDLGLRSSSVGEDLSFSTRRPMAPSSVGGRVRGVSAVGLDTRALAEASRNLTQTLRQLSSEVLTNKPPASAGGHQGSSVSASHKKQNSSCNFTGSQRSSSSPNATGVHDIEPSKQLNSTALEYNNLSASSENSSLKTSFKSTRSGRTSSSGRSNIVNSDKLSRSSAHGLPGAPVAGATGGEIPVGAHGYGEIKRGSSCSPPHQPQGAIIESMQHHGKGVFSGTFSGTLNPALQDRQGRPKRDISTIIHILNDLLCATPHYTNTAAAVAAVAAANSSKSSAPASAAAGTSLPSNPTGEPKDSVSAEDAATRSRVQHIQAMLEQRAERRRARRLARTAGSGQPYSLPCANLSKNKQQQSSSKHETQSTKSSTLKCPSVETSSVSEKKSVSEEVSILYTDGIESNIDTSAKNGVAVNADASLSTQQQQQQQQQHQHQHLMRELLKGCVAASTAASSALQHSNSGSPQSFPDCENECKQQLENNYSGAAHLQQQQIHRSGEVATIAMPTESSPAMEVEAVQVESQPTESASMDVDATLESAAEIDSNQSPSDEGHVPLKLPQEQQQPEDPDQQRSQQQQQDQQPQQPQQQKPQSSQQQEASGDAEQQDTAKIVSLNSGTVMA